MQNGIVKSMRSKFENVEENERKNVITRQNSDSKRNIKRTPAFRVEKNEENFFRNSSDRSTLFESKLKQFSINKTNNDNNKPVLIKSKSSHDFKSNNFDMSMLYTEPIPKALRTNNNVNINEGLTDTLRLALKKPLPKGPAPKKPPRTFEHTNVVELKKNSSFLHDVKKAVIKPHLKKQEKVDPKYMLNKLEFALKNNKLKPRSRREINKNDISTSEDSDDSLLFRSKSARSLPKIPNTSNAFNLNCCTRPHYEIIKEPNSLFFVSKPDNGETKDEPIYAEPYCARVKKRESTKSTRNSLYYMSTPLLMDESNEVEDENKKNVDLKLDQIQHRQISTENSSLSSFTSDMDTSPIEETSKIKNIIACYENQTCQNRLDTLKYSLRETLEKSFNDDCCVRDSDSEEVENKVLDIVKKFETYRERMPKYCQTKISKDKLFYCCLIIEKVRDLAQIKFQYPKCVELPQNLESLCFPEGDDVTALDTAQSYTLLITNDRGERMFGYCRRVLPEGCTQALPLAYCILSKYRAPRFYKKVLLELESRHGIPNKSRDKLIGEFYHQKFPKHGDSIKINLNLIEIDKTETNKENLEDSIDLNSFVHVNKTGEYGILNKIKKPGWVEEIFVNSRDVENSCSMPSFIVNNEERVELVLTLHPDSRYEDSDLKHLHQLPADIILKIFSSLLLERKVILISSMISKLSSCIDSLQSILHPFTWHHTFIPILPEKLWDIVESPTPVICGVLSRDVMQDRFIENGIVVDLDSRSVVIEEGDEMKILSGSMQKVWRRSIALANKATSSMDYVHSVYLSDAYLQVFIMCFKEYKKFFHEGVFQKEDFIKSGKTKGIRRFLNMFTETYMFLAFLDTALNNPENLQEFDKKIEMYGSEDSHIILDKLLEWNR